MAEGRRWLPIEQQQKRNDYIMRLKDKGKTYAEIAPSVGLSPRGVKAIVLLTRNGVSTCREK